MTIDLRFRPSQWAVAGIGSGSGARRAVVNVERPLGSKPSRRPAPGNPATFADGASIGLLAALRCGWARLVAPRDQDAAGLARRFESQMPNLAAELRYFAALDSIDERRGGR